MDQSNGALTYFAIAYVDVAGVGQGRSVVRAVRMCWQEYWIGCVGVTPSGTGEGCMFEHSLFKKFRCI